MEALNFSHKPSPATRRALQFWPLLLPLLFFLPGLNGFPYPSPDAPYSDLAISHYPNALYLKRALSEWGVIPLWSPAILSGYPFAANPLSGLWYPPGWLALLFPFPLGFNLLVMAHLLLGGVGLYRLLRIEGLSHPAALFGALAFESLPKLFAHYGAGHLTLVYAIAWTPWLLACHVSRIPSHVSRVKHPVLRFAFPISPGMILALIFLADPRWAPYAGLLWLIYVVAYRQRIGERKGDNESQSPDPQSPINRSRFEYPTSNLQYLISNLILSALLAAPLALPLLEYTRLSTRSLLTAEDIFAHSLPPARLLGLLFPDFGGYHEWMLYPGGVVLALLLVAVLAGIHKKHIRFWLIVLIVSALFALGSNLPLLPALARIPGFDLLRVPARALFLTGLAGAVLAAHGVEALIAGMPFDRHRVSLVLTGLSAFCVVFALSVRALTGAWAQEFLWGAGVILLASLWVFNLLRGTTPRQIWLAVLFGIAILDWHAMDSSVLSFRLKALVSSAGKSIGEYLAEQPGDFRVYSPSYSLPQVVAAEHGLALADGVDPLQLAAYADFMEMASGVQRASYSVTLPPFASGNPDTDNAGYTPDAKMLGLLNVGYVVAAFPLPGEGLALRELLEGVWIYENTQVMPKAWVQPIAGQVGDDATPADVVAWQPNEIILRAEGPGLLVLSEISYPGWRVSVDGESVKMETPLGLLRGVRLVAGEHIVAFSFHPSSVYLGLGCFVLGIVLLIWARKNQRQAT